MAVVAGDVEPGIAQRHVGRQAEAGRLHHPVGERPLGVALRGRLAVPACRPVEVLGHAAAVGIALAEQELRIGMALLGGRGEIPGGRSEEHTSELQSLMRISYAVFGWKKIRNTDTNTPTE